MDEITTMNETASATPVADSARAVEEQKSGCCGCGCGCGSAEPSFEEQVRAVVEKVRPFLQMDGGDIELIAIEDCNALVRLHGACVSCSISDVHMKMGVETAIKREIPEFGELIVIDY